MKQETAGCFEINCIDGEDQSSSMRMAPSALSSTTITQLSAPLESALDRFGFDESSSNASTADLFLPLVPFSSLVDVELVPLPFKAEESLSL